MLTVPEAARRVGRDGLRVGKLRARKVGTQHLVEQAELDAVAGTATLPLPDAWRTTWTGEPQPDWVAILGRSRRSR